MKRFLAIMLSGLVFAFQVRAQQMDHDTATDAFGYPHETVVKVIKNGKILSKSTVNPKPDCNEKKLLDSIKAALEKFMSGDTVSLAGKRKQALILKNIDNFSELDVSVINPDNMSSLAAKVVELKINQGIDDENIKVCQSDNPILEDKVFAVLYDINDVVAIELIDFDGSQPIKFIYPKN